MGEDAVRERLYVENRLTDIVGVPRAAAPAQSRDVIDGALPQARGLVREEPRWRAARRLPSGAALRLAGRGQDDHDRIAPARAKR
jgi:hypothetical protein